MSSKQAQRNSQKRSAKKEGAVEEPSSPAGGSFVVSPGQLVEICKTMLMGSCLVKFGPKMPHIMKADAPTPTKEGEEKTGDEASEIFEGLASCLVWHNPLGLPQPAAAADSMTMWSNFKSLAIDWGPEKRKRDTASVNLNRILQNLCSNFPQYLHIFMGLLMLQAFLFRSFFACLPWLFVYQNASLLVPLKNMEMLPQVPLDKCPLKFRVAGTVGIHALVWFFFLYEALWRCNFFVEGLILGLIVFHAHSVKPGAATN